MEDVEKRLVKMDGRRERTLAISREAVRLAGKAITMMHAREKGMADELMEKLGSTIKELSGVEKGFEYNSLQAHQEYVEACVLQHVMVYNKIPTIAQLKEGDVAYLLGLLDAVGELKREAFQEMMAENPGKARGYYNLMTEIYDSTLQMRFASSMLPDFRKKQDSARIQIENTGRELLSFRVPPREAR